MIHCLTLSKRAADEWQRIHPPSAGDPLSNLYTQGNAQYADDDTVALVAVDGDRPVGKVVVRYTDLLVNGRWQRCQVPGDLFVAEAYRSKAVGMLILLELLRAKRPLIASGVSQAAAQIYDRLPQFHRVDSSPMYLIGLDFSGSVRVGRLAAQRDAAPGAKSHLHTLVSVLSSLRMTWRVQRTRDDAFEVLEPTEAVRQLDSVADAAHFCVQVPWSRTRLAQAIGGQEPNHRAWVLRERESGKCWLMTVYGRPERVSLVTPRDVREVHVAALTEVFPPVDDFALARFFVRQAARGAAEMGATLLFVCAATRALEEACTIEGMPHLADKSVYVCPNGADAETASALIDPSNWWCRARSEEQFREAYLGTALDANTPPSALI